jgi:folate-binding protein YgfZ
VIQTTDDPGQLASGVALVDVGAELISVTGADRISFLHRLMTGNAAGTPVGGGCRSLLLDLKAHVVADLRMFVRTDDVRLVTPPGQSQAAATALTKYAVMDDFTMALEPALGLVALYGPRACATLEAAGVAVPEGFAERPFWSHATVAAGAGTAWLVRARGFGAEGVWVFADAGVCTHLDTNWETLGVPRLGEAAAEVLRIVNGEPRFGNEITSERFPMEVGLSDAIDYAKGCFLGQEPLVRIRDRGHVNWRLALLRVEGNVVPVPGDAIETAAKPRAGHITSAARLPGEPPVALALLHTSIPDGAHVTVQSASPLGALVGKTP